MIFERSVRRELGTIAGGVFTTIVALWVTMILVRTLGDAAGGKIGNEAVVALIALSTLNVLPTILVVTLFVSVLMALTRAYRDSEMVVWFGAGLSLTGWIRPVLRFALPWVLAIAMLSLWATPWANRHISEYKERFAHRDDVSKVVPGQFRESGGGQRVFFVEGLSDELKQVRNVFVRWVDKEQRGVIVAKTGRMETQPNGDRFLVLERGRRYDTEPGTKTFKVMGFDRYGVKIAAAADYEPDDSATKTKSTRYLLKEPNPKNQAELLWRIGLPLAALNFCLLAVPLAFAQPRRGRSSSLMVALLAFFVYLNVLSLMQSYVGQDRLQFALAWWSPHVVVLASTVFLFWLRVKSSSPSKRSAAA